jgi:hypothetical protein
VVPEIVYIRFKNNDDNSNNTSQAATLVNDYDRDYKNALCCVHTQVTSTLESENKLVLIEKGADFESTVTFDVSGNQLTVVSVASNVQSNLVYF